jgi:hypothetical protein
VKFPRHQLLGFAFLLLLRSQVAGASDVTVGSHTSSGANTFIQDVNGSGSFGPEEVWNWDLDSSYSRVRDPSTLTTSGTDLIETTKDFRGGMGWSDEGWNLAGTIEYAVTPDEDLSNNGLILNLSRRVRYGEKNENGFQPWWSMGLTVSGNDYRQVFNGKVQVTRRKTRPITGENLLNQRVIKADLKWRPIKALSMKVSATGYNYNRNVADFEAYLNSSAAANRGMGSLSGTVGGLPASQVAAGATWYFIDDWDLLADVSRSIVAADRSVSTVARLSLEYDLGDNWHFALGEEHDTSVTGDEWLTLVTFEYTF